MFKVPSQYRITEGKFATTDKDGNKGTFLVPIDGAYYTVVASDDSGWETISIKPQNADFNMRLSALAELKELFWANMDLVIQYIEAPKDGFYHLWRQKNSNSYAKTPPDFLRYTLDVTERFIMDACMAELNKSAVPFNQRKDLAFEVLQWWKRGPNIKPSEIMEHLGKRIKIIEKANSYA